MGLARRRRRPLPSPRQPAARPGRRRICLRLSHFGPARCSCRLSRRLLEKVHRMNTTAALDPRSLAAANAAAASTAGRPRRSSRPSRSPASGAASLLPVGGAAFSASFSGVEPRHGASSSSTVRWPRRWPTSGIGALLARRRRPRRARGRCRQRRSGRPRRGQPRSTSAGALAQDPEPRRLPADGRRVGPRRLAPISVARRGSTVAAAGSRCRRPRTAGPAAGRRDGRDGRAGPHPDDRARAARPGAAARSWSWTGWPAARSTCWSTAG